MGAQKSDLQCSFFFSCIFQAPCVTIPSPGMAGCAWPWGCPSSFLGLRGIEERATSCSIIFLHLLLPGAASGKQDEEPPAVPSHPLRGDDHCHHPVHQPGCPGVPALRGGHSGQHNTQPAQLLVSPCGELKDWGVPDREVGEGVAGDSLRELIWVSMRIAIFAKLQGVRQGLSDV